MNPNLKAFLDTIAYSEIGPALLAVSDDGYNVIVGSTAAHPDLFTSYDDHPRKTVLLQNGIYSTAAGRYQILRRYFDSYKQSLRLPDFGHDSQDKIAVQMCNECHAVPSIVIGQFDQAIILCKSRWASLPGANYPGQHMNKMEELKDAYIKAGGTVV